MAGQEKPTTQPDKPKQPAGRPTNLTRELVDKAGTYIGQMQPLEVIGQLGLAVFLKVSLASVKLWGEKDSTLGREFSAILGEIEAVQHYQLTNNGLTGRWKAPIAGLMLSKHGYVKEVHQNHTTNGAKLPTPILRGASQHINDDLNGGK